LVKLWGCLDASHGETVGFLPMATSETGIENEVLDGLPTET
jgi:hypothetical protein